jgi:hypothetical protein
VEWAQVTTIIASLATLFGMQAFWVSRALDRVYAALDRVEVGLDRVEERLTRVEVRLDRVETGPLRGHG